MGLVDVLVGGAQVAHCNAQGGAHVAHAQGEAQVVRTID